MNMQLYIRKRLQIFIYRGPRENYQRDFKGLLGKCPCDLVTKHWDKIQIYQTNSRHGDIFSFY